MRIPELETMNPNANANQNPNPNREPGTLNPNLELCTLNPEPIHERLFAIAACMCLLGSLFFAAQDNDWAAYGRDAGGERFSPLTAITRENVASLQIAWTYRTGDAYQPKSSRPTAFEATPLYINGTLYLGTPLGRVIALDPISGRERWVFDAKVPRDMGYGDFASRGVSAWRRGNDLRIFVATVDARLIALDAKSGGPITGFGDSGTVDLRKGLRIAPTGFADYEVTSPPAIVGNTIVVGSGVADNGSTTQPSGEVRGFDAISGRLKWTWDPIPQNPSELGANTWRNSTASRTGAANAWSVIVADPQRNLVFVPTSSPSPDYFGGERLGDNLFANSIVALRADTGARVWHFQTVHHDLWDYDVASPPILFDWRQGSRRVPAVAVAPKAGQLFILNRETGEPLIPVNERAVPKSDVPGEEAAPTQPFPTAPPALMRTTLTADEAWGITDEDRAWCKETMSKLRSDGFFTPPSLQGTLVVPGNIGGMAWGGIAHDRVNDLLITPVNNLAAEVRLIPRDDVDAQRKAGRLSGGFEYAPQRGTPYGIVRRFLVGPKAHLPCTPPPWGTLTAVKASTGAIAWQVPLGQLGGTEKLPDAVNWGSMALGGPIVTAGSLVFTAGTFEAAMYAFDVSSGKQLWKGTLPTSARATPMTYLGPDGRQYVVIAAGGHGASIGPPIGDHLVAFALPRTTTQK
jgi:quinoprotein glucose dehydrogenase